MFQDIWTKRVNRASFQKIFKYCVSQKYCVCFSLTNLNIETYLDTATWTEVNIFGKITKSKYFDRKSQLVEFVEKVIRSSNLGPAWQSSAQKGASNAFIITIASIFGILLVSFHLFNAVKIICFFSFVQFFLLEEINIINQLIMRAECVWLVCVTFGPF